LYLVLVTAVILWGIGGRNVSAISETDMTGRAFADELEEAADQIADISRADLQILLRRAALLLRNTEGLVLEADVAEAFDLLSAELKRPRAEVLQTILIDWLISGGRLPADALDEQSGTDGTAKPKGGQDSPTG
jgi:hypothetical protein